MVTIYSAEDIRSKTRTRTGETKIGQQVKTLTKNDKELSLQIRESGCTFVLLGIPEDIGVRANFGRPGAYSAWEPALFNFLNMQSNRYLNGEEILVLGHVTTEDLMKKAEKLNPSDKAELAVLRELVSEVDKRVADTARAIARAGAVALVVGGGHNNSFPLIDGFSDSGKNPLAVINADAHADLRPAEGRHSGNGFRYAFEKGYLSKYHMIGLQENYNSEAMLELIAQHPAQLRYTLFEDLFIRESISLPQAIQKALAFCGMQATGIEIDMDTIQNSPSSAKTSSGFSANHMRNFAWTCAQSGRAVYLHIAEAAPVLSHIKADNKTGKLIAYLLTDFIKGAKKPN